MAPTTLRGIGPAAQETFDNIRGLVQLLAACENIRAAHQTLSGGPCEAQGVSKHSQLNDLVDSTPQQSAELHRYQEMLPAVQQRLLGPAAMLPQLADL